MPTVEIEVSVAFTSQGEFTPDVLNSVTPVELMVDAVDIRKKIFLKDQFNSVPIFQVQSRSWVSTVPLMISTGASLPNGKLVENWDTHNNFYITTFSGRVDLPTTLLVETEDITIDIIDTQDYVYITGSGAAVGLIPFWS